MEAGNGGVHQHGDRHCALLCEWVTGFFWRESVGAWMDRWTDGLADWLTGWLNGLLIDWFFCGQMDRSMD